ncbi:MAG TPA: hypothetical protein VK789_30395 [Bryobacteraceae bacterium]|nr:hypothetical protein [Bryobacteraceae bacterium]
MARPRFYVVASPAVRLVYLLLLLLQYGAVRQAASNYGILVTTVLALKVAALPKPARVPRVPTRKRLSKAPNGTPKAQVPKPPGH